jgi:hypothetical protein
MNTPFPKAPPRIRDDGVQQNRIMQMPIFPLKNVVSVSRDAAAAAHL